MARPRGRPRKIENLFNAPKSNVQFSEGQKSKGILDDYAVRGVVDTTTGTVQKVPANAKDIVNKEYVDAEDAAADAHIIADGTSHSHVVTNDAKVTNVSTNLSAGTRAPTTIDVNSSDGTNATLVEADTTNAGILGSDKWDEIVANTAAKHAQSHTVASHSDTTGTGAELDTLTDGSNADTLHEHTAESGISDYAEGSWTPSVGTMTITGTFSSSGTYTKIGRLVIVRGRVSSTNSISATAGQYIGNLPFTAESYATGTAVNAALTQGVVTIIVSNSIYFTPIASTTDIDFTSCYFTAA